MKISISLVGSFFTRGRIIKKKIIKPKNDATKWSQQSERVVVDEALGENE